MSQEVTVYRDSRGSIVLFSGGAGRFYDAYGPDGKHLGTTSTKNKAVALLNQAATNTEEK